MAILFEDTFEQGNLNTWTQVYGSPLHAATNGVGEAPNCDVYQLMLGNGVYVRKALGQAFPHLYFQLLFNFRNQQTYAGTIMKFMLGTTVLASLWCSTAGVLNFCQGERGGTVWLTAAAPLDFYRNYLFEIYYMPDATAGVFECKVDGAYVLNLQGGRTVPATQNQVDTFTLGGNGWASFTLDNIRVADNAPPPYYSAAAPGNDFASDPACMGAFQFEYGPNFFANSGNGGVIPFYQTRASFAVGWTMLHALKGACGIWFRPNDGWAAANSALPDGFPLKSNDTNKNATFTVWWTPLTWPTVVSYNTIFSKQTNYSIHDGSFCLGVVGGKLTLYWYYGTPGSMGTQIFSNICDLTLNHKYHIGLVINGKGKTARIRLHDATAGTTNTYNLTATNEIGVATQPLMFNEDGYPGTANFGNAYFDEFTAFNRCLTDQEIDDIRNDVFGAAIPPAECRSLSKCETIVGRLDHAVSLTTCQHISNLPPALLTSLTTAADIQRMLDTLTSLTSCEGIPSPVPVPLRSLTICQGLQRAMPNSCMSKTLARDIILDGGDFFLTF